MGISDNLSDSFSYATDGLVGKWSRWLTLIVYICVFPLINGYILRVLKGGSSAPSVDDDMFIDGIKVFLIQFVYFIFPFIIGLMVLLLTGGFGILTMGGMQVNDPGAFIGLLLGSLGVALIVWLIFAFIFSLFCIIGMIRFARTGSMSEAFAFSEIMAKIGSIGWISYIIAMIVLGVVLFVIYLVLILIPIIGWLLVLILAPLLSIIGARYQSNLYDSAE